MATGQSSILNSLPSESSWILARFRFEGAPPAVFPFLLAFREAGSWKSPSSSSLIITGVCYKVKWNGTRYRYWYQQCFMYKHPFSAPWAFFVLLYSFLPVFWIRHAGPFQPHYTYVLCYPWSSARCSSSRFNPSCGRSKYGPYAVY